MKYFPILFFFTLAVLLSCSNSSEAPDSDATKDSPTTSITVYEEPYRPRYHFSPPQNWINDPNGLVYHDGEYHLFYQYNPFGDKWGHMSWGHAASRDLLHWAHLPVAIYEEDNQDGKTKTMAFSGSAVIDKGNRSNLCPDGSPDCMVAIYTSHVHENLKEVAQHQSIAFSHDRGRTFTKYANNPVLDIGEKDFRDPKVFWHEATQKWVMLVALPKEYKVLFYSSPNLTDWVKMSEFGGVGDTTKVWECPDLVQLKVHNEPGVRKWALLLSTGHPKEGYHGMQYFVGNFDGTTFSLDPNETDGKYIDYGKDFYAAVTWNNEPYRRPILLGWMNSWTYANDVPTQPWRGSMSLPRRLQLRKKATGYTLIQSPLKDVENLRGAYEGLVDLILPVAPNVKYPIERKGKSVELQMEFELETAKKFGIKVFQGHNEETVIGYDVDREVLYLDRIHSGQISFNAKFASREEAPLTLENGKLSLIVYLDYSTIEIFANRGEVVMSELVFPSEDSDGFDFFAEGGTVKVPFFHKWQMMKTMQE